MMRFLSSFPGLRRFASGFVFVAIALVLLAPPRRLWWLQSRKQRQ